MTEQPTWQEAVQTRLESYKQSSPFGNKWLEDESDGCAPGECIECDASRLYREWLNSEQSDLKGAGS
jgi:hypothetical protein